MRKKDSDALHNAVVLSALVVLGLTLWAGGRRLYSRWQAGSAPPRPAPERPAQVPDGYDRPPSVIPPLALVGIAPDGSKTKPRPKPPAARPMPPITPDRE